MTSRHPSIVLAVSGGLDSICLMHMANACALRGSTLRVATFDHRTGTHGKDAVDHVVAVAAGLGLPVHVGRARTIAHSESAWRQARWAFLREVARQNDAVVATAHTSDDHLETVVMRLLRGAGARGLAGLLADTPGVVRPLVQTERATLTNYAKRHDIRWVDDPTNQSRRFFRNRVRLDLLPALRRLDPSLPDDLLRLADEAALLRRGMERLAGGWVRRIGQRIIVTDDVLALPDAATRAAAWPAILGPQHVVLDRRGIVRLSGLDLSAPRDTRVPLAGGWEATRVADGVRVRRLRSDMPTERQTLPARGLVHFGPWTFDVVAEGPSVAPDDAWSAWIPGDSPAWVRPWEDGDRIAAGQQGSLRRVKRFFADHRIAASDRKGWPVVIANGEIIWIPGIRRATAASVRSGRPVRLVVCERIHH